MSSVQNDAILIKGNEAGASPGVLHTRLFTSGERMGAAAKMLAICWLLAVVTAFIPIAHFLLVPLFVLAGPVVAYRKYAMEAAVEKATGSCPACGEDVNILLDPADKLPKHSYCSQCNKPVQLVYDSAPVGE